MRQPVFDGSLAFTTCLWSAGCPAAACGKEPAPAGD